MRYYEDEKMSKYKGSINCDYIDDIKILPNTSIKKYGKDKCIELITENRTYVIAGKDSKARNLWYKSFKKVLFGEEIDRAKEQEKWKQRQIEEEINNSKLFDSLSLSTQQHEQQQQQNINDENKNNNNDSNNSMDKPITPLSQSSSPITKQAPKETMKQPSIFVDKNVHKKAVKTNPYSQQKTNPYSQQIFVEKRAHKAPKTKSSEPFIMDKMLEKQGMDSIDDENVTNTKLPKSGSNGHHISSTNRDNDELQDSMGVTSDGLGSGPIFVDQNTSINTINRVNLANSLGTVDSVNFDNNDKSISGSNGNHPLSTSMTPSNITDYTPDSMISNASGSNGHHNIRQNNDQQNKFDKNESMTKDSAVFTKQFLEAEYEEPTYGLLDNNEVDIIYVEAKPDKCCGKCVIL